ncbi:MAG: hypothetical protein PHS42_03660 [Sulfurimonas sp.]|nr:hypothetical protein [Sulfurimonas sp.]MDD3834549.1 hypothetical protein [Sulfurimonas sp.]
MDVKELKDVLEDITFQALKLEGAVSELKDIEDLSLLKEQLKKLENWKIDTTRLEEQFEREVLKIGNKIDKIKDKVDFNELDEINEKLIEINRKTKPQKFVNLILLIMFAFLSGYGLNIYRPIIPVSSDDRLIKVFKDEGLKLGENNEARYIVIPENLKFKKLKNGYAVMIQKNK